MTPKTPSSRTTDSCPECGALLTTDPRFVAWCTACEWNVDPLAPAAATGRWARRRESAAQRRVQELLDKLRDTPPARPGWSAARLASYLFAGLVHALALALVIAGGWLVIGGPAWPLRVVGVLMLVVAVVVRPRLGRIGKETSVLDRTQAPALFDLLDQVATQVGARQVDLVAVTGEFNAAIGAVGLRRRRVLFLGVPLWTVLSPQERVFLLAHELAHDVNGDCRHGLFVGSSRASLVEMYALLVPGPGVAGWDAGPAGLLVRISESLARLLQRGLAALVYAALQVQERLLFRESQQAEYRADLMAARVASSRAAASGLDLMLTSDSCGWALQRAVQHGDRNQDLWAVLRAYLADMPEHERERLRRVAARRVHRADVTHPPTLLRISLVRAQADRAAEVVLTTPESDRIDAHLDQAFQQIARDLRYAAG